METDPRTQQAQVDELALRIAAIEDRLATIERRLPGSFPTAAPTVTPERVPGETTEGRPLSESLPVVGSTVLIIGGAFVLRAITEAGWLGPRAGSAAGIVYAIVWIIMAGRVARPGRALHATLYGAAATVIAFPLLWETTVRFEFLTPPAAAAALVAITAFALVVCSRGGLHGLAWWVALSGGATAVALAVATRQLPLFLSALLLLGLTTLWIGWARNWLGIAGVIATPAFVGVLLMTGIAVRVDAERLDRLFEPTTVIGVQIALVLVYIGSLVVRTLTTDRELGIGEIALGVSATVVGLGGAMAVVRFTGVGALALGFTALLMAISAYGASFTLIDRRTTGRTNFVFYTTLAFASAIVGFEALLTGVPLTAATALAAVVAAWAGSHWARATLSLHGALYAIAAAVVSGLLGLAVTAFSSSSPTAWNAVEVGVWIALPAILGAAIFRVATHGRTWGRLSGFPKLALVTVALLGCGGVVIAAFTPLLVPDAETTPDAAALAVLRTAVLALAAVAVAWLSGCERFREARWLVYPVLVVAGLKLFLEDFRSAGPATLVLSLALFGGALILAPRIASRKASPTRLA